MNEEITKMFDVFYANIKFGLVPLSGEMQNHLRELEDRVVSFKYDIDESDEEYHWGCGYDSGFSEGYDKGTEEGYDEGFNKGAEEVDDLKIQIEEYRDMVDSMRTWYKENHR
jgi:flagellar biosynthesis/type III secretory pathway protein FliH